jgi:hypothetical protein
MCLYNSVSLSPCFCCYMHTYNKTTSTQLGPQWLYFRNSETTWNASIEGSSDGIRSFQDVVPL